MNNKSPLRIILAIIIGFIHDFAAGCWAASVMAVFWLSQQNLSLATNPNRTADVLNIIHLLKKQFFYGGIIAIFIVMITGAGRSFTYVNNVYGSGNEKKRRSMLIIKHIFLLIIFSTGTYWQYTMIFN